MDLGILSLLQPFVLKAVFPFAKLPLPLFASRKHLSSYDANVKANV